MATQTTSGAKLPGYETTFITRAELSDDALKALNERLHGVVGAYKGTLVITEDWGKRKLAYPIEKEARGNYTYLVYTGTGDIVHEMERNLRLNEHVLRFLTVNLEKEFDSDVFTKRRGEIQEAAKRREAEREARREERMAERRGYDDHRGHRDSYEDRGDRHAPADDAPEAAAASDEE